MLNNKSFNKTKKNRENNIVSIESNVNQFDRRFQLIIVFVNFKHFRNFNEIKQ